MGKAIVAADMVPTEMAFGIPVRIRIPSYRERRDGLRAMMAVVDGKLKSVLGSLSTSVVCVGKRSEMGG